MYKPIPDRLWKQRDEWQYNFHQWLVGFLQIVLIFIPNYVFLSAFILSKLLKETEVMKRDCGVE